MNCKACNYYIPAGAILCANCGTYLKSKWRNYVPLVSVCLVTVGIAVNVAVVTFIGMQSSDIKTQTNILKDSYEAEHRPYLYLDLRHTNDKNQRGVSVWEHPSKSGWYGGGDLHFINVGKVPASIISTKYIVASNQKGDTKLIEQFRKEYGEFTDVKVVMPNQEDVKVSCHPIIVDGNENPQLLYIGATITYKGSNPDKTYWYKFSQVFIFEQLTILTFLGHPHTPDHDWDQNKNIETPILKVPVWQEYLSLPYIQTLLKIE